MKVSMIIAIDGHSACGKSTLAKDLANALHIKYLDSGAIYRAICYYCLEHQIDPCQSALVVAGLKSIDIQVDLGQSLTILLNGSDVSKAIRLPEVSRWVSEISTIPEVRQKVNGLLRSISSQYSLVMDGRDIGTVVFPDAQYKFFLTADKNVRAQRRHEELLKLGKDIDMKTILHNLEHRDYLDSTREDSPLRQAEDAVLIDNTHLSKDDQLKLVLNNIHSKNKE